MTDTKAPAEQEKPLYVDFSVSIQRADAYALAELCKRIGWTDAERLSASEVEGTRMLIACDAVRAALSEAGVSVR